jgi:hypothetical protein
LTGHNGRDRVLNMSNNSNQSFLRYKNLADRARRGVVLTASESAELETLETSHPWTSPSPVARTIFDLPICKGMWESDARDISR